MLDLDFSSISTVNKFKVCDRCKATNVNTLIPKLKELDEDADITVGCHSYCGPGRNFPVVSVNRKPIVGENEAELIDKVRVVIGK